MDIITYDFRAVGDQRGSLIAIEGDTTIPFSIKRIYYIFDTKEGVRRGYHAHKKLRQVLICVRGSCKILLDNGKEKKVIPLDKPSRGLLIEQLIWREMYDFTSDCVLLVLASDYYNENDYIRDYSVFLETVGRQG
ncbi:MAG: FdtA/QdtA family cupin domain-containing protein [Thermodesulfobacteriota bacterium]|nr:FdtA/QdtA family cupin domain-containing protein [Thermodesulfobacteriota bacterium]